MNLFNKGRFILFLILALGIGFAACVPVHKQTYLQEREKELKNYPKDSVVKEFSIEPYQYKLQSGDVIMLQVKSLTSEEFDFLKSTAPGGSSSNQDPLLSGYEIGQNGTLELPFVGEIVVEGLTINEARNTIAKQLSGYLKSPVVHLKLLNFKITVLGEVGSQTSFYSYNPQITVLEAIAKAGGVNELADRANVKIVRNTGGKVEIAFVNLLDINLIESPYYYLQPNDQIIVRPLKVKTFNNFIVKNIGFGISIVTAATLLFLRISN
jgi:polysaccharide export outer membrane protein